MSDQQPEQTDSKTEAETDAGPGTAGDISDDQLPEDLQPSEDNPLARHPEQTGDESDQIGADREGDPERAPLSEDDADYAQSSDSSSGGPVDAEEDDGSSSLDNGGGGNG